MKKCCHMSQHLSIQNTISGSYHEKRGKMFIFVWVLCIFARHFYEQCICMKIFWFQGLKLCNCWCESIQTWKLNKNIYDSEIWQNMSFNDFPFLLHIWCKVSGGFLFSRNIIFIWQPEYEKTNFSFELIMWDGFVNILLFL